MVTSWVRCLPREMAAAQGIGNWICDALQFTCKSLPEVGVIEPEEYNLVQYVKHLDLSMYGCKRTMELLDGQLKESHAIRSYQAALRFAQAVDLSTEETGLASLIHAIDKMGVHVSNVSDFTKGWLFVLCIEPMQTLMISQIVSRKTIGEYPAIGPFPVNLSDGCSRGF